MRVGGGSDEIDRPSSWAGAVTQKSSVNPKKAERDGPTDRRTDGQKGGKSRVHATKNAITVGALQMPNPDEKNPTASKRLPLTCTRRVRF